MKIPMLLLLTTFLLLLTFHIQRTLAIDTCLDHGGRWDYTENLCDP